MAGRGVGWTSAMGGPIDGEDVCRARAVVVTGRKWIAGRS